MGLRGRIRRLLVIALTVLAGTVVILNWTYGRLPSEPRPSGSFIHVGKLRIRYVERPGPGTPVVLIHGLPGTADDFDAVTALLAGHRTIALDRPGFGYSSGGYVSFDKQLEAVHELLAKLGVSRPIIVGHSYGGTIALGMAERYPGEVGGLVLVDAAAGGLQVGSFDRDQARLVKFLQMPVIRQVANATFGQLLVTVSVNHGDDEAFSPQPVVQAQRRRLLEINMTHGNLTAFAGEQLAANGVIKQIDKGLSSIAAPAVVVQGDHDKLIDPKYARRLAAALRHARLVMVRGGHMAPYTHPFAVATAIESLAGRQPAGGR